MTVRTPPRTYGHLLWTPDYQQQPAWGIKAEPHVMMRLKRILPRGDTDARGMLLLRDTPEIAAEIEWLLLRWPLEMSESASLRLKKQGEAFHDGQDLVAAILDGYQPPTNWPEPSRPARSYQQLAADLAHAQGGLLVGDAVGVGKTMTGLLVLRNPDALPAVVVCPTHLPGQWLDELQMTLPWLTGHIVKTTNPYDTSNLRGHHGHPPDVLIIPYTKLNGWASYLEGRVNTVVFDEIQDLRRGTTTNKGRAAAQLAAQARYKVGLSATPIYNLGIEIWNIFDILLPGVLGSREEFIREWCRDPDGSRDSDRLHDNQIKVHDPAALGTYLRDLGIFIARNRKDVGREILEPIKVTQPVDTDHEIIDKVSGDVLAMARLLVETGSDPRERWEAAGQIDWRLRQATGIAKARWVSEYVRLVLEQEPKVVVWAWHREVWDIYMNRLREFRPVLYTGSESPTQKARASETFIHGDSRVLLMSLRSGSGLNGLQNVCSFGVFGELDWSPGVHEQCLDAATQILTRRGFLGPDEIDRLDEVAAFDRETSTIRWRPIIRMVDRPLAAGEQMYALHTPGSDLRLTGGHRMVFQTRYTVSHGSTERRSTGWRIATAEELSSKTQCYSIPVAGHEEGIEGVPLTDAEIELLGWFITDGNLNRRSRQLSITQAATSEFNDEIRRCLTETGLAWSESHQTRTKKYDEDQTMIRYLVHKFKSRTRLGRGWSDLEMYLDKNLAPALDQMSAHQLAIFLRAMHMGDGGKQRGQNWTQRSYHIGIGSPVLADRLQSLCIRRGWRANLSVRPTPTGKPHFTLHTKPGAVRSIGGHGKPNLVATSFQSDERVWCVENDLGTIVVRRNGKTAIVGNCIGRLWREGQQSAVTVVYTLSDDGTDPLMADVLGIKEGQAAGIRDPNTPLLGAVVGDPSDRTRRLAEWTIARAGHREKAAAGQTALIGADHG